MLKVLLVEDEEVLRESYYIILTSAVYDVDVAVNGKEALELCEEKAYDLILLDLMMPVMDGTTFLEHLSPAYLDHTKVIILSNLSSGSELERAMKLGAHSSILKATLSPKQLLTAVRYEVEAS